MRYPGGEKLDGYDGGRPTRTALEDFGPTLWVVNTIFTVLATFAVIARFGARRLRKLSLGADDWIICMALFWD